MNKLPLIARLLLGVIFFVFGLNGFFHFMPMPPPPEKVVPFMTGMASTGYFFPLLALTQTVCGALLLAGAFVPLALVVLAPVILNIFLFHVFLETKGLFLALFIGALEIYLSFFAKPYSSVVKEIFRCPKKEAMNNNPGQAA